MNQPCGCCTGIEIVTPESEINRPGLPALAYRAGTYATFFESMLARLSNLCIEVPSVDGSSKVPIYPLKQLTARGPSDASIALLDAWAIVADVLTFYEERIANEGYLRTAVERRSILELARLVGYRLRPGVASSVYLAFTVSNGFQGDIPAETRAQSIPGTGEKPQFFETSEKLAARDAWNNLKPRLTRPQIITPPGTDPGKDNGPLATGADITDALYFKGTSTNLKVGDALLFVFGGDTKAQPAQQVLRFVESINPQTDQNRTQVTLVLPSLEISEPIDTTVKTAIQPFINKARTLFPDSDLAASIVDALTNLIGNVQSVSPMIAARVEQPGTRAADYVRGVIPVVQQSQDIAVKRGFTRLTPWTGHLLQILQTLVEKLPALSALEPQGSPIFLRPALEASPLRNLYSALDQLALPPSVQPPNSQRLPRTITQAFAPQSDVAPRLLATFKRAAADTLYQAWANVETPTSRVEVQAARVKAGLFASNFPGPPTVPARGKPVTFTAPNHLGNAWNGLVRAGKNATGPAAVALDATYDQIKPGSWAAIDRPSPDGDKVTGRKVTMHRVMAVQTRTMDTGTGFTAKVTLLNVDPPWLSDSGNLNSDLRSSNVLRGTVVYAQTELLNLAEEPRDQDIEGGTIELADLYDGLESGRRIMVSGNRTDIPNVSGVAASELVMIAAVNQGSQAAGCATASPGFVPFSKIEYTTDANVFGDRLVVGRLSSGALDQIQGLPPGDIPNQAYCNQVQLAPGVYVNAYVPTADERQGKFPDFRGLLTNPDTKTPYPEGTISPTEGGIFAWRISSEPVHTILNLASPLAYKYDASAVTLYGNVVNATHGQTVAEVLGNGDAGQGFQTFALHQSPLTYLSAPTQAGTESTLTVRVNEIEWHEDDLAALGPKDRGFITKTNDADQTSVIFGNGEHGARPPSGSVNIKSVYRYGIGKPGNVKAQQISQLATRPLGAQSVINPLPATGGADRDSADQARRNTPLAVKALDRLVAVGDYADFARTFAGIGKAAATRLSDGRRQLVHVTIAGADDIPIDINSDLYRNLVQALHQYGDPYLPIQVCVRKVKLLVVSAGIRVRPDYQWESVEQLVRAAVVDAFSFERSELGQSAFLSEAMSLMQGVKGVAYVDVQVFDGVAEGITASQLAGLAGTLGRNPFVEADLAKLDPVADPAKPCERIRPAELVFLTPDIPDTLILTEITG